jgi:PhoH-like ATPase
LLDPEISLVVAIGRAGTGKTLLSVAAGIEQVLSGQYSKLLIARPHIHFGNKDTDGFLPGDLKAKTMPWMLPIDDNVEKIMSLASKARDTKLIYEINRLLEDEDCGNGQVKVKTTSAEKGEKAEEALIRPKLESMSISHVRGRSLNDAFVLIDEAQNLDRLGVKTLVSRMGENSKMVVVGDLEQIDVRWLDELSSGLSHLAQKSLGRTFCGVTYLDKPVRSQLAEFAAEHL